MHRHLTIALIALACRGSSDDRDLPDSDELGAVVVNEPGAMPGYTLVNARDSPLVDAEGQLVRRWPGTRAQPSKLLPGGDLLTLVLTDGRRRVTQLDWDGDERWGYGGFEEPSSGMRADVQREGNPVGYPAPGFQFVEGGDTLVLAYRLVDDPRFATSVGDQVVYAVDGAANPTGFRWSLLDHLDELGLSDASLAAMYAQGRDIVHLNAMSELGPNRWYDEGDERFHPDNLILSAYRTCLMFVVSRETGEVVWRLGPDQDDASAAGPIQGQHHAHFVPEGLPGAGNLLVFDNGAPCGYGPSGWPRYPDRGWSRVVELDPTSGAVIWEFGPDHEPFASRTVGSVQRLPNGNTLLLVGDERRVLEVTPDHEIVWEYRGTVALAGLFRAYRVPADWLPVSIRRADDVPWGL